MPGSDTIWMTFTLPSASGSEVVPGFPDVEAIVAAQLRDSGLAVGDRAYTEIPADPVYPLITVQRVGGVPAIRRYLDAAEIQIDVWGTSKAEARDIADAARVACHALAGTAWSDPVTAWVSAVEDSTGLLWLPDDLTGQDRYLFGVRVFLHE